MSNTKALDLAQRMESESYGPWAVLEAAAELRRLVAENESLRQQLAARGPDGCVVADVGFRWDGERQHHVPKLVVEFEPVPANSPCDAKGWKDRDAVAAMLSAAPSQPAPVQVSKDSPSGEPMTDELEAALAALVNRCNNDAGLTNDDAVIAAEAVLERLYKSRAVERHHNIKGKQCQS